MPRATRPPAGTGPHPSARTEPYPQRWWALVVLTTSLIIIVIDNTILNVALPTLVRDLGATNTELQWIVDAYVVVFAGLLLTMGALGDRFGRRGALEAGLVLFGAASLASAFATSPGQLIATRAAMGIGGALIMPATLSIITNIFPSHERGRAIGVWAGVSGAGIAFGPLLGGWLLESFWWGSVFLINLPIVVVALVGGRMVVPTSRDPQVRRLDPVGAVLSIAALATLVTAIIEAPLEGWTSPRTLLLTAAGVGLLAVFLGWERHTDHPMLDLGFFRRPRFSAASVAITLTFFAMFGSLFALTQYLQFVLGHTPLQAGLRTAPMALTMAIVAPASARLVERVGTKVVVASGLGLVTIGLASFASLGVAESYLPILARLVVLAVGMGMTMAPATESIMGSLPLGKAGVGSAVNDTTRQVGGALGVAILGSVLTAGYQSGIADAIAVLPARLATAASDSVGAALGIAAQVPAGGEALAAAARGAFVDAMGAAVLVAAAVAGVGALVTLRFLPARAPQPDGGERAETSDRPAPATETPVVAGQDPGEPAGVPAG